MNLISPGQLLSSAWALYRARWKTFIGIMLVFVAAAILLALFVFAPLGFFSEGDLAFTKFDKQEIIAIALIILFGFILFVIQILTQVALIFAIKDSAENIGIKESFRRASSKIRSYLWVTILQTSVIALGFILLIVPGIIFAVWYSLASYVIVVEDIRGMKALEKSKEYVKGRFWPVAWRLIVIGAVSLLLYLAASFLPEEVTVIGSFLITPLSTAYIYHLYTNLRELKQTGQPVV